MVVEVDEFLTNNAYEIYAISPYFDEILVGVVKSGNFSTWYHPELVSGSYQLVVLCITW